jgi:hypothetical protein
VTEFGRFTHPASTPEQQSTYETAQAQYYDGFLSTLLGHRADWNLGPVLPYAFRDAADPTVTMWGLRRTNADDTDAGPKLAWDVFTSHSRGAPDVPLPVQR